MDNNQKDMKGTDKAAIQSKNDTSKSMIGTKSTDQKSGDKKKGPAMAGDKKAPLTHSK